METQEDRMGKRMGSKVLLLGTTNLPWALDIAMILCGFDGCGK